NRRIRVTRSASGEGLTPSFSNRARIKRSIGLRHQDESLTAGSAGRVIGWKDQCLLATVAEPAGFSLAGAFAPWSIQARSRATCCGRRRSPFGGMTLTSSAPVTARISRLALLLPGTMAGPELPPVRIDAAVSRRRLARCFSGPWQLTQFL